MMPRFLNSPQIAIKLVAAYARGYWAVAIFSLIISVGALTGCALLDKPTRATMYDFGPGVAASGSATRQLPLSALPPLAIDDITTSGGALENMAVLYRLGYLDARQLRPYSQARWSMPAAQLVQQRLRELLSRRHAVLRAGEGVALNRSQNVTLPLLRLELEEFSHLFTAPDASVGLIRLRATLVEVTSAGEKLLGQRNLVVQRPATSSDAPGGVRALAAATDAAIEELDQWLGSLQK